MHNTYRLTYRKHRFKVSKHDIMLTRKSLFIISTAVFLGACTKKQQPELTPWGTVIGEEMAYDSIASGFSLNDIISQGELIMLTISGPDTYYDYHGHGMGVQYLLCENFASQIGVKLRVELCKDSAELISRLKKGEGDIIAYPIHSVNDDIKDCGPQWKVRNANTELADTLNNWYDDGLLKKIELQQKALLASGGVERRVYSPMLNRSQGVISRYDGLFQKYAPVCRLDWRLLAAQCYQESCFDPKAHSWAGACGLMQILPSTASHLGLPHEDLYSPEPNIAAAARYMKELMGSFTNVATQNDRICFALASYNGGSHHIHDAQALTKKYGGNPSRWNEVAPYVLKLQQAEYYKDPVVKYGFMRGSETVDYVQKIQQRWRQYRGVAKPMSASGSTDAFTPHASKKANKYKI